MKSSTKKRKDYIGPFFLLLFSIVVLIYVQNLPELEEGYPGPALFPGIIGIALFLASLGLFFQKNTAESELDSTNLYAFLKVIAGLSLAVLFPFLYDWLTFIPALGIICFGMANLFKIPWKIALIIGIGTPSSLYLMFRFMLGVPL